MERYPDNFEGPYDDEEDFTPERGGEDGFDHDSLDESGADSAAAPAGADPAGLEWFDDRWLRANGVERSDDGDIVRVGTPVLVLLTEPGEIAMPGEEMDTALREFGMLAWRRRRATMAGTLIEQFRAADRSRREWIAQNPFAAFWAATARSGPRRRRSSRRRS